MTVFPLFTKLEVVLRSELMMTFVFSLAVDFVDNDAQQTKTGLRGLKKSSWMEQNVAVGC